MSIALAFLQRGGDSSLGAAFVLILVFFVIIVILLALIAVLLIILIVRMGRRGLDRPDVSEEQPLGAGAPWPGAVAPRTEETAPTARPEDTPTSETPTRPEEVPPDGARPEEPPPR